MRPILFALLMAMPAAAEPTITPDGLPPVKIGMTQAEAERALQTKLVWDRPDDADSQACHYVSRADGRVRGISYMVENGRITRIDVDSSQVQAPEGTKIGTPMAVLRRTYGARLKSAPRPYQEETDFELTLETPDHHRALVFETSEGKVNEIRAGLLPSVHLMEGCE